MEVDKLSKTANEQRGLLGQKQQEADHAMDAIQKSMQRAVERKNEVEHLQAKLSKEEEEMTQTSNRRLRGLGTCLIH